MKAYRIADKLAAVLFPSNPDQLWREVVELAGHKYIVTDGTGDGCFAYDCKDIQRWLDNRTSDDYQSFCDACCPEDSIELAVAVYLDCGKVIDEGGSCRPVLDDAAVGLLEIVRDVI